MRLLLIVILGAVLAGDARAAAAEDGPECFSKFTKFNVCEKALTSDNHSLVGRRSPWIEP
jgi:hypothetical protein